MTTNEPGSESKMNIAPGVSDNNCGFCQSTLGAISLLEVLGDLVQKRYFILSFTGASALIGLTISLILPVRYTASVVLLPPQQNPSIGASFASQASSLGTMGSLAAAGFGLRNPNDMFVAMLKGRTLEDGMVKEFDLMAEYRQRYPSDARRVLEKRCTVDGSGKDGLIHISVEDGNPVRAAILANGYVEQFRKLSEGLAITEASQRRLFFEKQLEQARDKLAESEEALKKTEQTTGMIELDSQARALIQSAASLRAQVAAKEVQIQSMRTFATEENPQLKQAQQELDGLRSQLAKLGSSEDGLDGGLIIPKGKVPLAGLEYVRKLRDVKYNEAIFDILARQFEIAKLDEAKQGSIVQVVDVAVPPDRRSSPRRGLIVILLTGVGFIVSVLISLSLSWIEQLKRAPEFLQALDRLCALVSRAR